MFKRIWNKRKGEEDKRDRTTTPGGQSENLSSKAARETIETVTWESRARRDARHEAGKGQGSLKLGSPEEQMKRLSEQMAKEAQHTREINDR